MSQNTAHKPSSLLLALAALAAVQIAPLKPVQADEILELEVNEGQVVRLPRPAENIFIGNPEVADISVMSPRIIYIFGKTTGSTTFYAMDGSERIMAKRDVRVGHNLGRLRSELDQLLPGGKIRVASVNAGILLSGEVPTERHSEDARLIAQRFLSEESEQIINRLQVVVPNQVNLRVRIAEVTNDILEQLDFSWENIYDGAFFLGIATGNPVFAEETRQFLVRTGETDSIVGNTSPGDFDINGVLDMLAEDGMVAILAEPNLTAVSGETASFLAGGEFPIAVSTSDEISIEFKKFGVSLSFTPTVLDDRRISLLVRPEVSELSNEGAIELNNLQIPALRVRRTETTVELGSGQSFAIAGLQLQNTIFDTAKTPGLGDIPILGALFTSKRFEQSESELAIIVTPYLVKPSNRPLATPMDRYVRYRQATPDAKGAGPLAMKTIPLRPGVSVATRPANAAGFIVE